jgi:hypothetical protein
MEFSSGQHASDRPTRRNTHAPLLLLLLLLRATAAFEFAAILGFSRWTCDRTSYEVVRLCSLRPETARAGLRLQIDDRVETRGKKLSALTHRQRAGPTAAEPQSSGQQIPLIF